jgi:hypothetical protein
MQFISLIFFALSVVAHSGWKIPRNQPAGAYAVTIDANGTFVHTRIYTPGSESAKTLSMRAGPKAAILKHDKRQGPGIATCATNPAYSMPADRTNMAYDFLVNGGCQTTSNPLGIYGEYLGVVVYWCNYSGTAYHCDTNLASTAIRGILAQTCGSFVAGW